MTTEAIQKLDETRQQTALTYAPRADIYSSDTGYEAQIEMPGVAADALDITLEKGVLTVRVQTQQSNYEGYEALAGPLSPVVY